MTNATKTLALIFAGALALALATSWNWSTSSSAAFQQALLGVDTSAVQAVQVDRPNDSPVRLERSGNGWSVAPADTSATYPADAQAVSQLLSTLPSLQVNAVATRQPDKHPRYGVDSTGTRISLLGAGNESLGSLIVGRTRIRQPQSQGNQGPMQQMQQRRGTPITYVRAPDRPDVYSVEQSLASLTRRSIEDWRDKRIWAVDRSQIQRIEFTFPGDSSFTMQRAAPDDTTSAVGPATWVSAGDTLSTNATSSLLRRLSSPQADGFAEELGPEDLNNPRYSVSLRFTDGSVRTLKLSPAPTGDAYLATADGFEYVARLQKNEWDRSVLQGRSALLSTD
jgi:hypothetical protein